MVKIKAALTWLRDNGRLVGVIVLALLGFVLGGAFAKQLRRPDKLVRKELDAIDAGKKASQLAIDKGADHAVAALKATHATTIASLDAGKAARVEALQNDPAALAALLSRLSK